MIVKPGDEVAKGRMIGKVGNSDFSQKPHLHIQAAWLNEDTIRLGIPGWLNNRWLVRNALIEIR